MIPSKEKKVVGRIFCLSSLKCSGSSCGVGQCRASADEHSALVPERRSEGTYFYQRLLSNQQHLGGSLLALAVSKGAHQPSAAAHPSSKEKVVVTDP